MCPVKLATYEGFGYHGDEEAFDNDQMEDLAIRS